MLRTNSKKAKENIKNYIVENFDFSNYEGYKGHEATPTEYKDICKCILDIMNIEKFNVKEKNEYETFKSWCQGLPSLLDTCYYYNRSAKEDLKNILEQTEEQVNKYTEEQSEEKLTYLLYREIKRNANN